MRILLTAAAVLLLAPAAARADLPMEVDGVRAERGSGGLRIVFGPDARDDYKKIAGRRVTIECETVPPTDGPVLNREDSGSGGASTLLVAPKKRKPLKFGKGRYDICRVEARRTTKRKRTTETRIVLDLRIPVTQRGAVFLDEAKTATLLSVMLEFVKRGPGQSYRTAENAIQRSELHAVPLASPDATPPADRLGLYSDAAQHATAVAVTASGRRVFIDVNADSLSTNLSTVLFSG